MPTTQCLRVATHLPLTSPAIGDAVQVQSLGPIRTRYIQVAGGTFPVPSAPGDVMRADASLNWIAAPVTSIIPAALRAGDYLVANVSLQWASTLVPTALPTPVNEGDVLQVDASAQWIAAPINGAAA